MESINITEEKQNPLFDRKEVVVTVENESAPSKKDVLEILAKQFSVEESAIKLKNISSKFGSSVFTIYANIYPSKDEKEKVEYKTKKEKEEEKKLEEERLKAEQEAKAAEEAEKAVQETESPTSSNESEQHAEPEAPSEESPVEEVKEEEKTE